MGKSLITLLLLLGTAKVGLSETVIISPPISHAQAF
jgi:hypothetical protein